MMYSEIMGRLFETMEVFVDEGRQSKSSAFSSKENLNKFL